MVGKILTKNREDIHCDFKMDKKSKYFIFVAPASLFFKIFPKKRVLRVLKLKSTNFYVK